MLKTRVRKIVALITAIVVLIVAVFSVALVWYSHEQNKTIIITSYTVSHAQIPASFEGKRIVHLTDLHNKEFGDQLTQKVKAQEPDIIVITGDWISYHDTDITVAKRQAQALVGIAPIYYVTGNHEARSPLCNDLLACLKGLGVVILENEAVKWTVGEDSVQIIGMFDPEFSTHLRWHFAPNVKEEMYSIFLFHRPEYFEETVEYGADLLLCGHTHGGQIRLPFIGSLYAPSQLWFPIYDTGRYDYQDGTMLLSQGLGESVAMRILTPPEMVVVTLDSPYVS